MRYASVAVLSLVVGIHALSSQAGLVLRFGDGLEAFLENDGSASFTTDGYQIQSSTNRLDPVNFHGFQDYVEQNAPFLIQDFGAGSVGFTEAGLSTRNIAELSAGTGATFAPGAFLSIGHPFNGTLSQLIGDAENGDLSLVYNSSAGVQTGTISWLGGSVTNPIRPSRSEPVGEGSGSWMPPYSYTRTYTVQHFDEVVSGAWVDPATVVDPLPPLPLGKLGVLVEEDRTAYLYNSGNEAVRFDGYQITSNSDGLNPTGWRSVEDVLATGPDGQAAVIAGLGAGGLGLTEANPSAAHLAELTLGDPAVLAAGERWLIGQPFATDTNLNLVSAQFSIEGLETMVYAGGLHLEGVDPGPYVQPFGFVYQTFGEAWFTEIQEFPEGFAGGFEVYVDGILIGTYTGGESADLAHLGWHVREFIVTGLSEDVGGGQPLSFPLRLGLSAPGAPLAIAPISNVPEPASGRLLLLGCAAIPFPRRAWKRP